MVDDDDPMTRPRDTSRRSEHIPERSGERAERSVEGPGSGTGKAPGGKRPAQAVRQDAGLGDTSTRDETRR